MAVRRPRRTSVVATEPAAAPHEPPPPAAAPPTDGDVRVGRASRWRRHRRVAFGLGMLSALLATVLYLVLLVPFILVFGVDLRGALITIVTLVGPVVEESAKLGLVLAWARVRRPRYGPEAWMALGAFAGFGFAVLEDVTYWLTYAGQSVAFANFLFVLRLVTSLPVHGLATGVAAYGFFTAVSRGRTLRGTLIVVLGVGIHASYNSWLTLNALGVFP